MEIRLKKQQDEPQIILSDDELDNSNFVELFIEKEGDEGYIEILLGIDEVLAALGAFQQKRVMEARRDNNWKE
jgi:hypothetical protein